VLKRFTCIFTESDEVITDGASAMAFIADIENEVQALPDVKDTTVLKKDSLDVQKVSICLSYLCNVK
jgi:hypothetical protein